MRLDREIDLITQMVQALYDAENQLVLALPRVATRTVNPALRDSLRRHLDETKGHAARLEQIATILRVPCAGRPCHAMEGLLKEGEDSMGFGGSDTLVDAAIIASCQGVEHFEISQYRALSQFCARVGAQEVADLLAMTLSEEEQASTTLDEISTQSLQSGSFQSPITVGLDAATTGKVQGRVATPQ